MPVHTQSAIAVALTVLVCLTGSIAVRAEYLGTKQLVYPFKPLTTALVVILAAQSRSALNPLYQTAIVAGLLFALAGDVFLMLPFDRFVAGLASFLGAHVCYIIAFSARTGFKFAGWIALPFVLCGVLMLMVLWPRLDTLRVPVAVYTTVIVVMAWQATAQWTVTWQTPALLAAIGATLFLVSDAVLAYNRFRRPFQTAPVVVLSTYYVAQLLIAWSVAA